MRSDFVPEMRPLGPRLEAAARALSAAKEQLPAWIAPLSAVMERLTLLPAADAARFARVEATDLRGVDAPFAATPSAPERPPDAIRERLRALVGPAADAVRVHHDAPAHKMAHMHHADAVAVGADVYFAHDRYQPHDTRGFALLAHETVHVAHALQPDAPWKRTGMALAAEESEAHATEHALLQGAAPRPRHAPTAADAAPFSPLAPISASTAPATQRPMVAATDRTFDAPASAVPLDMESLRQTLMRDLLAQLRADMERGG